MRTGYSAIADEWIPIKPGADGALLLALVHEIMAPGPYDRDFLARYTNVGQLVCPSNTRLFGDVHDPESTVSVAIREHGGYALMPEWNTRPANHYLQRRRTGQSVHAEDLARVDNPLKIDGQRPGSPEPPPQGAGREDYVT